MSWGAAMLAALLIVLPRPMTWVVALAAFLVRGGVLLFLVPIVVVPSPVDLATSLGPTITSFVFGGLTPEFALIIALIFAAFLAWLLVGGAVAAATERALVEAVATDDDSPLAAVTRRPTPARRRGRVWRILIVRLAGHIPLAVVLGWGALRIVQATYLELTSPSDVIVPIALRVLTAVPDAVIGIVAAWTLGEILGSLGARRLVLRGLSVDNAYLGAWADLLRRPAPTIATFVGPTLVLLIVVGPISIAARVAWDGLRVLLATERTSNPLDILIALVAFIAVWATGLVAAGLLSAWRSAAWTIESVRARRTFGVTGDRHPGDWIDTKASGSL